MRTLKELAKEAIQIQDASNLLGLSKGFAEAVQKVADNLRGGLTSTSQINCHPINQLWTAKLHDLSGMGFSDQDAYSKAYEECKKLAAE